MSGPAFDRLRDHSIDDIQEYDNALPGWWLWMFYLSIVFGICYLLWYHYWGGGLLGGPRWTREVEDWKALQAIEEAKKPQMTEEQMREVSKDPKRIAHGQELFGKSLCIACHGPDATGLVGPNLRDRWWLYGSRMSDLVLTITEGRANNIMPAQRANLRREDIVDLAIFIVSLNRQGEKAGKPHDPARDKETPIDY
jgi:cytochrome c oxidase cbb3-type subunit 3